MTRLMGWDVVYGNTRKIFISKRYVKDYSYSLVVAMANEIICEENGHIGNIKVISVRM